MRFKSQLKNGYRIYAVAGINTISFAIDGGKADKKGLLGFSVEREDSKEKRFLDGFKVFKEVIPHPNKNVTVSTYDHPVQSFVWDDFTAKPNTRYSYDFYPVKGKPKKLIHKGPIRIEVKTEPLYSDLEHDVFFNRGVVSSQAYERRFENIPPDKIPDPKKKKAAFQWLSRELDDAILKFINSAEKGDTLLGCFYEFRYLPVVQAFKDAADRGVNVKIIVDAKNNEHTDKKGKFHESFPRTENLKAIAAAKLSLTENIVKREANRNDIQHNKFCVHIGKGDPQASQVWTGSTNISEGGIFGQTNVGHWIRNHEAAEKYRIYWDILSKDPGANTDDNATNRKANDEFKKKVIALTPDIEKGGIANLPLGVTPLFSPRKGAKVLESYAAMVDTAEKSAAITLAFGIGKIFKDLLSDNTSQSQIIFMLLEKQDKPDKRSKTPFLKLGAKNNVYQAFGAYIDDPVYKFARETNNRILGLNKHVSYIHSKFLLMDPLKDVPVVVTGSANFSEASTSSNDENMVVIKGDKRVADIYFTEFNRLFNHYYFRSVHQQMKQRGTDDPDQDVFLQTNGEWLEKYKKGKFRHKRIQMYAGMEGTVKV